MSLLATQGIGIFDRRNYVVDANRAVVQIPRQDGTHLIAWKALLHWSELTRSTELLQEIITPGGLSLSQWQGGIFTAGSFGVLGTSWLKQWGMDIAKSARDQIFRNESSYRPSRLRERDFLLAGDRASFVRDMWRLCEPSGLELFQKLDRYLLRMWVRATYAGVRQLPAEAGNAGYVAELQQLVDDVNPQGMSKQLWIDFLSNVTAHPESSVLSAITGNSTLLGGRQHLEVLARALMLLRLATGACRLLLSNSGLAASQVQFWWHRIGEELGLWDRGQAPPQAEDLWLDVRDSIEDLDTWTQSANPELLRTLRLAQPVAVGQIDETERIAMWGLGL